MIRFDSVSKTFPTGTVAIRDVSFHVGKGEFVFLTGHSGAGKSTVLRLVYAETLPTRGSVRVSGFKTDKLKRREVSQLRRRLGIVFQDFALLQDRSAEENVAFALEVTGARRSVAIESPRRCLAEVSPITQRTASMTLDLPQPLGPTTPTRLLGISILVGSTKDLKPASLILLRRIGSVACLRNGISYPVSVPGTGRGH